MGITLYNTKSKGLEPFEPLGSPIRMYSCGPTVYGVAHIGNIRAYVCADILKRTLMANGYAVTHVINITDIGHLVGDADEGEDKMTLALKREGKALTLEAMKELGGYYTEKFKNDLEKLHIIPPNHLPKASEHISEDINLITQLQEKGFIYATSDGLYFDTEKMPHYGEFAGLPPQESLTDHQRIINNEKKNPRDFAVWKFNDTLGYEAPFGKGFPGWHIECSAMSMKYLGKSFDIHTGGIDHIPVHHQNEIAQSECATGEPLARYWIHSNFLKINNEKLSKSLQNEITLDEIITQGISGSALRLFYLTAHYQSLQNFTWDALHASQKAWQKITAFFMQSSEKGAIDTPLYETFLEKINNNLNSPEALAVFWEVFRSAMPDGDKKATLLAMDEVFGLGLKDISSIIIPEAVKEKLQSRETARTAKDYPASDTLREEIKSLGFDIIDTDSGSFVIPLKG